MIEKVKNEGLTKMIARHKEKNSIDYKILCEMQNETIRVTVEENSMLKKPKLI